MSPTVSLDISLRLREVDSCKFGANPRAATARVIMTVTSCSQLPSTFETACELPIVVTWSLILCFVWRMSDGNQVHKISPSER